MALALATGAGNWRWRSSMKSGFHVEPALLVFNRKRFLMQLKLLQLLPLLWIVPLAAGARADGGGGPAAVVPSHRALADCHLGA